MTFEEFDDILAIKSRNKTRKQAFEELNAIVKKYSNYGTYRSTAWYHRNKNKR